MLQRTLAFRILVIGIFLLYGAISAQAESGNHRTADGKLKVVFVSRRVQVQTFLLPSVCQRSKTACRNR